MSLIVGNYASTGSPRTVEVSRSEGNEEAAKPLPTSSTEYRAPIVVGFPDAVDSVAITLDDRVSVPPPAPPVVPQPLVYFGAGDPGAAAQNRDFRKTKILCLAGAAVSGTCSIGLGVAAALVKAPEWTEVAAVFCFLSGAFAISIATYFCYRAGLLDFRHDT